MNHTLLQCLAHLDRRVAGGEEHSVGVAGHEGSQHRDAIIRSHQVVSDDHVKVSERELLDRLRRIRACYGGVAQIRDNARQHLGNVSIVVNDKN